MSTQFIETDCTIEHEGKVFESGGAFVSDDYIVGYMSKDMNSITTWHGDFITPCRVTSSWKINSYMSDRMYQVYASIKGKHFTGRTLGAGMIVRLKACK